MVIKQNNKDIYKYQPYLDKVKNIEHRKSITLVDFRPTFWKRKRVDTLKSIRISEHANSVLAKKLKI